MAASASAAEDEMAATAEPEAKRARGEGESVEETLLFAEAAGLGSEADFAAHFARIAEFLLDRCVVRVAGSVRMRITEVEAYFRGTGHGDPFPHGDVLQRSHAHWYFHRSGATYRGGSFKGVDITFGPEDFFGGFIVRGMRQVDPPRAVWDGPCVCVDNVLRLCKCASIAELVDREGTTKATADAAVADPPAKPRLLCIELAPKPHGVRVYKTARVGLTLKGHSDAKDRFIMRNYRYLTEPRETKKGRQLLIVSLHRDGMPNASIAALTGSSRSAVEHCCELFDRGRAAAKDKDTSEFRDKQLTNDDVCTLYGWADAHSLVW